MNTVTHEAGIAVWAMPAAVDESANGPTPPVGPGVLIVDPDPAFRAEFASAFRGLGWKVWATGDPADAVRLLRRHADAIRAAVVDLQLPGLQGVRVLAECQACNPNLVRCAMSAGVPPYTAAAFRRLSETTLFTKPFDLPSVSAALRWLIGAGDDPTPPSLIEQSWSSAAQSPGSR